MLPVHPYSDVLRRNDNQKICSPPCYGSLVKAGPVVHNEDAVETVKAGNRHQELHRKAMPSGTGFIGASLTMPLKALVQQCAACNHVRNARYCVRAFRAFASRSFHRRSDS